MKALTSLPDRYHPVYTIDLPKNPKAMLWLNIGGFLLLILFSGLFGLILHWLRPNEPIPGINLSGIEGLIGALAWIIGLTAVMLILHEAVHGVFFWIFTRTRPKFAFKGAYAYAAAPGWYLPRNQYLVTGISPLIVLSILGILLLTFVPPAWFSPVLFVLVFNASGAVGDLWVVYQLLLRSSDSYANDLGDAVTIWTA